MDKGTQKLVAAAGIITLFNRIKAAKEGNRAGTIEKEAKKLVEFHMRDLLAFSHYLVKIRNGEAVRIIYMNDRPIVSKENRLFTHNGRKGAPHKSWRHGYVGIGI